MPYRQLSGIIKGMPQDHGAPDHTTIFRRIQKMDIDISNNMVICSDPNKSLKMIAVPSALRYAVAVMIRYLEDKARVVKLHLPVNSDTKTIVAAIVTGDRTGDSPILKKLLGTVADQPAEPEAEAEAKEDSPQNPIAVISGTESRQGLPPARTPIANRLASGVSPLAMLSGFRPRSYPSTRGARHLQDPTGHAVRFQTRILQGSSCRRRSICVLGKPSDVPGSWNQAGHTPENRPCIAGKGGGWTMHGTCRLWNNRWQSDCTYWRPVRRCKKRKQTVLEEQGWMRPEMDSRDNNNICIQASVWEQCACTKIGKHSAGDQTQGSHMQQVSGGACNAVRSSRKGTGIF